MPAPDPPYRQVHLDFHTGPAIPGVAADFDAERFARTLAAARVESVQLFARDWHGWTYYPSAAFPDRAHPNLTRPDLLGEQVAACHDAGLRCPIYTAVQVDRRSADLNPDWCQRAADGGFAGKGRGTFEPGWDPPLCLNSPYRDFFLTHLAELLDRYDVDGFWLDGVSPQDCCCRHCRATMAGRGLDVTDRDTRRAFGLDVCDEFMADVAARVRAAAPDATLFFNNGHVGPRHRRVMASHTHLEIESLPGGGWGYLHFPVVARYARTLTDRVVGMTGRFHTGWGEFHALKNPAALEFECFSMLAHGARASVGDQLHPRGVLDEATYGLIGGVFREIEAIEPLCRGSERVVEAAVVTTEGLLMESWESMLPDGVLGAVRMLQELGVQFDVIDPEDDPSRYDLLILPGPVPVGKAMAAYLDGGGAAVVTGDALLDGDSLAAGPLRVRLADEGPAAADFVVPLGDFAPDLPRTEHVIEPGCRAILETNGDALATLRRPYHPRTWDRFCGHRHAPSDGLDRGPAVVRKGNVVYLAHKVFTNYRELAPLWTKRLVAAAIDAVHDRLVTHDGPSTLQVHLRRQGGRHVLHLLSYVPERRGRRLEVIEEPGHVPGVRVSLRLAGVASARAVRSGRDVPVTSQDGRIVLDVPPFAGYEVVEAM